MISKKFDLVKVRLCGKLLVKFYCATVKHTSYIIRLLAKFQLPARTSNKPRLDCLAKFLLRSLAHGQKLCTLLNRRDFFQQQTAFIAMCSHFLTFGVSGRILRSCSIPYDAKPICSVAFSVAGIWCEGILWFAGFLLEKIKGEDKRSLFLK